MSTRTVLVTGAGGAGRTTVAAATALASARRGRRVLLLTADRLGAAGAVLGMPDPGQDGTGSDAAAQAARQDAQARPATGARPLDSTAGPPPWTRPIQAAPGLWAARIDSTGHFRTRLLTLQDRGRAALDLLGAHPLDPEEVTELPGAGELAFLQVLTALHDLTPAAPGRGVFGEADRLGDGNGGGAEADGPQALSPSQASARPAAGGDALPETGPVEGPPHTWDLVVLDMQPVPEALALLALPEQLRRYLRRLLPPERQAARALRPLLAQLAGAPMPAEWLYETAGRYDRELAAAQALLESGTTTVRIVVEPGSAGTGALRAARFGAALYGLAVDIVANRLLPTGSADPWLADLSGRQRTAMKALYGDAGGAVICELPHLGREPRGLADLGELIERAVAGTPGEEGGTTGAAVAAAGESALMVSGRGAGTTPAEPGGTTGTGAADGAAAAEKPGPGPVGPGHRAQPPAASVEDRLSGEGILMWRLPLPGAERGDLRLVRRGDELLLTVGPFHRTLPLPSALRRCSVSGAGLSEGELRIRFTPDRDLWPQTAKPDAATPTAADPGTPRTPPSPPAS